MAFKIADLMNWRRLLVGQRLPAQRLDLAVVPGDARRAHRATSPPEQKRAILCDNVAELYGIDVARLEAVSG